jgi:photosystem II stability/assembly factor-like uncharacterized protein
VSQRLKIAFVLTLVLVNVGLVFLVREKMADSEAKAAKAPTAAPTTSATSTTPSPEPTGTPGGQQSLTVSADDAIFRIHGGACDGKDTAGVTVSTDNGATFDDVGLPEDAHAVLMLTAEDRDTLDLVAAPQSCKPQRFVSTDGGETWEAAEGADVWFLGPRDRVTAPVGVVEPGCTETLTLSAPNPNTGRVFCASGVLVGSNDAGETWARFGAIDGVRAAAYVTARRGYALAPDGGCATGSYATEDGGRTWTATGCLDAGPGRALAANRNIVAAIGGDAVYVSEDGGRTWTKG